MVSVVKDFRQDINALRAFAVLSVLLYHFFPQSLTGGFLGVDVFFVISGYLMTKIIMTGLEHQSFSIIKFYLARAKRILPALLFMCLLMLMLGWFVLLDSALQRMVDEIFHASTLTSNLAYREQAGYFDVSSLQKWMLHTWSLSVEWQFYLFFPVALMLLFRVFAVKWVKLLLLLATVVSFALALYASSRWPSAAYYLLPTRAWEMLAGGLVFLYPWRHNVKHAQWLALLGWGALILACFVVDSSMNWPGIYTGIIVLASVLLLQVNVVRELNYAPIQSIGLWSYSIYLWHWPIVVWVNKFHGESNDLAIGLGLLLSIALGFLSYRFIESNFRQIQRIGGLLVAVMLMVVCIEFTEGHFPARQMSQDVRNQEYQRYAHYRIDPLGWYIVCNTNTQFKRTGQRQVQPICIEPQAKTNSVFLWGDSHLGALSPGIRAVLADDVAVYQLSASTCVPSFERKRLGLNSFAKSCNASNRLALTAIAEVKPQVVIMAMSRDHQHNDWMQIITQLKDFGVQHIIVVGPVPQYDPSLPEVYLMRHYGEREITDANFRSFLWQSNDEMKALLAGVEGVSYIDVLADMCQKQGELTRCLVKPKDTLISFDYGHLTAEGAVYISERLLREKLESVLNKD